MGSPIAVVAKSAIAAASAHVALSLTCIANGALTTWGTGFEESKPTSPCNIDASGWRVASEIVDEMYSGKGITRPSCLSKDCVFSDPVAICCGREELTEAFRALKILSPKMLMPAELFRVDPLDENITRYTAKLNQQYSTKLKLKSLLIVDMKETAGHDPVIVRFEERWNGRPLLDHFPFKLVRRINGALSFLLTPMLVQD